MKVESTGKEHLIPETTTSPHVEGESPPVDQAVQDRVRDIMLSTDKALRLMRLYERSNPLCQSGLDRLWEKYTAHLEDSGELLVTVTGETFLAAEEEHFKGAKREASLPFRLYRDGVRSIRFAKGLERDELVRLLNAFEMQPDTLGKMDEDLATILWRENFTHIDIVSVDEIGVARAKGTGQGESQDTGKDLNSQVQSIVESIKSSLFTAGAGEPEGTRPVSASELDLMEMKRLAKSSSAKGPDVEPNDARLPEEAVDKLRAELEDDAQGGLVRRVADIIADVLLVGPCTLGAGDALETAWQFLRDLLERGNTVKANEILDRIADPPDGAPDVIRGLLPGLVSRLGAEDSAGVILAAAKANPAAPGAPFLSLLSRLPASSLRYIARHLGQLAPGPVKDAWCETLLDRGTEDPPALFAFLEHEGGERAVKGLRSVLSAAKVPGASEQLRQLLGHRQERVRVDALKVCTVLPAAAQRPLLELGIADASPRVRFAALRAVEAGRDRTLIPVLAKRLEASAEDDEEPVCLVHTIAVLGGEEAARCLRKFLLPRQGWLPFGLGLGRGYRWRRAAAAALQDITDDSVRDLLEEGAASSDRKFAETCLASLARSESRKRVP